MDQAPLKDRVVVIVCGKVCTEGFFFGNCELGTDRVRREERARGLGLYADTKGGAGKAVQMKEGERRVLLGGKRNRSRVRGEEKPNESSHEARRRGYPSTTSNPIRSSSSSEFGWNVWNWRNSILLLLLKVR